MKNKRVFFSILLAAVLLLTGAFLIIRSFGPQAAADQGFDAQRAYQDVVNQVNFGPRVPGSQAHEQAIQYIQNVLSQNDWTVGTQDITVQGHPVYNIAGQRGSNGKPWYIIGAHYDSRMQADQDSDPANRSTPVPGANDGASGVAVLLELARTLPKDLNGEVWLVFFDSEDQGELDGWDWLVGSTAFADNLPGKPDGVVVLDMIGDADLDIYKERNSDKTLTDQIWSTAAGLGYDRYFIPTYKYSMLDDHTPFLNDGIPAVDVIDFDYPAWHTTHDTADKVSAESLAVVGQTISAWLIQ